MCNKLQHLFHTKKVGHSGTLDPFATGLLLLTINKACKIIPFLDKLNKTYIGKLKLGEETDTLDLTGKIIKKSEINKIISSEDINKVFNYFIGEIEQLPPIYSAIHYEGKRLYELARNGICDIKIMPRKVRIFNLKLLSNVDNIIEFECVCSSGTYIRSLARDIAHKLNTYGHLIALRRTKIGDFDVANAKKITSVSEKDKINIPDALYNINHVYIDNENMIKKIKDGIKLSFPTEDENLILLLDSNKNPLAIYEKQDGDIYKSLRGLF